MFSHSVTHTIFTRETIVDSQIHQSLANEGQLEKTTSSQQQSKSVYKLPVIEHTTLEEVQSPIVENVPKPPVVVSNRKSIESKIAPPQPFVDKVKPIPINKLKPLPQSSQKSKTPPVPKTMPNKPKSKLPIMKTNQMWKMNMKEMRQYLQGLYNDQPEPGTKSADEFIEYARDSIEKSKDPNFPKKDPKGLWEYPPPEVTNIGSPGDTRIRYTIAGKGVNLPYGYPEETIFILTVSYRDIEVAPTIARAFARAAHPERIVIGVHSQNEGGDVEPERDPIAGLKHTGLVCPYHPICTRLDQVRVSRTNWKRSEGPTVARALAEKHYRNETYVLGIDSHCHFLRGWDNVAIDMFKRIKNDLALITSYPPGHGEDMQGGYGGEAFDINPTPTEQKAICRTRRVNLHTSISFKHDMNMMHRPQDGVPPVRVAFFAAGFSFSRGHRIVNVPFDYYTPYIFDGEETSMGVRAWTWGYDLYQPDRDIISHLYIASGSSLRPVFWDSPYWGIQWPCQFGSLIRLQKQLRIYDRLQGSVKGGLDLEGKLNMDEFDRYDVGKRRKAEDFWKWAHIDIQNNWGPACNSATTPGATGREYCYSEDLCSLYYHNKKGGMPFVPWEPGT